MKEATEDLIKETVIVILIFSAVFGALWRWSVLAEEQYEQAVQNRDPDASRRDGGKD